MWKVLLLRRKGKVMKTITTVVKIFSGPDAIEKSPNRLRHSQMINITAL
ncbi:MAG TPA: hypothetical protein VD815_09185 [Candidatus Saccharimonadales bacterium]|nr:hypothetical protein [Candidatus Saccharimonadales bacterium]